MKNVHGMYIYYLITFNIRFFRKLISYFILKGVLGIKPIQQGRYIQPTQSQSDGIAHTSQIITPTVMLSNNQADENMGLPVETSNDLYIDDDDHRMTIINELKETNLVDTIQG